MIFCVTWDKTCLKNLFNILFFFYNTAKTESKQLEKWQYKIKYLQIKKDVIVGYRPLFFILFMNRFSLLEIRNLLSVKETNSVSFHRRNVLQ